MLFVYVCAVFGFHFVYAVVCLCACCDMVMHVGLSHFGCHVFPNHTRHHLLFSNFFMYMVFAMNEPLQAGSLCRLGAFAGCHNLLSKLFLKSTMWALFRPGFLCLTEARLKHMGLVFPFRKVHIHHTPWFFF